MIAAVTLGQSRDAPVGDRRKTLGISGALGGGLRLFPATNLGVELLAVVAGKTPLRVDTRVYQSHLG